jgi:hypothetical protein
MTPANPILLSFSSLANQFLLKNIDLGDKMYDNTVITICGILTSTLIFYISSLFSKDTYNWLKYKLLCRRSKDPFDLKKYGGYYYEKYDVILKYNRMPIYTHTIFINI